MKKVMYFICAATIVLCAASCGGGSNTPAGIQKSIYSQFQSGNYEKGLDIWFSNLDGDDSGKVGEKEQTIKAFSGKAKESFEKKGGLKSFEIIEETISEDGESAKVTAKLIYGDGSEQTETSKFVKKDGSWKISLGK